MTDESGSSFRDRLSGAAAPPLGPSSWNRRQSMIQLLGSTGTGVGAVGGFGARSPMMAPDSPVKANKSAKSAVGKTLL